MAQEAQCMQQVCSIIGARPRGGGVTLQGGADGRAPALRRPCGKSIPHPHAAAAPPRVLWRESCRRSREPSEQQLPSGLHAILAAVSTLPLSRRRRIRPSTTELCSPSHVQHPRPFPWGRGGKRPSLGRGTPSPWGAESVHAWLCTPESAMGLSSQAQDRDGGAEQSSFCSNGQPRKG